MTRSRKRGSAAPAQVSPAARWRASADQ